MTGIPIILLDVDGVLNACTKEVDTSVWQDWEMTSAGDDYRLFTIRYSPTVMKALSELHTSGKAEIRWLTTWEHHAQGVLAQNLGLPHFEVAGTQAEHKSWGSKDWQWWKFQVAKAVRLAEPDRLIIWIDDDHSIFEDQKIWAEENNVAIMSPRSEIGLTPELLTLLRALVKAD